MKNLKHLVKCMTQVATLAQITALKDLLKDKREKSKNNENQKSVIVSIVIVTTVVIDIIDTVRIRGLEKMKM